MVDTKVDNNALCGDCGGMVDGGYCADWCSEQLWPRPKVDE